MPTPLLSRVSRLAAPSSRPCPAAGTAVAATTPPATISSLATSTAKARCMTPGSLLQPVITPHPP